MRNKNRSGLVRTICGRLRAYRNTGMFCVPEPVGYSEGSRGEDYNSPFYFAALRLCVKITNYGNKPRAFIDPAMPAMQIKGRDRRRGDPSQMRKPRMLVGLPDPR